MLVVFRIGWVSNLSGLTWHVTCQSDHWLSRTLINSSMFDLGMGTRLAFIFLAVCLDLASLEFGVLSLNLVSVLLIQLPAWPLQEVCFRVQIGALKQMIKATAALRWSTSWMGLVVQGMDGALQCSGVGWGAGLGYRGRCRRMIGYIAA